MVPAHYRTGEIITIRRLDDEGARRPSVDGLGYGNGDASGWLVAVVRYDRSVRRFIMLTGQHPTVDASWTPVTTADGRAVAFSGTDSQCQRAALAVAFLSLAAGHGNTLSGEYHVAFGTETCDRCPRPLASNVMPRMVPMDAVETEWRGRTVMVGPECWERITGQRARRREAKRAAQRAAHERVMGRAPVAPTAPVRCPGTCAVDTFCPDCD